MEEAKYIDLLSDFGFKKVFGKENCSEEFLIDFLNQLFAGDDELSNIVSVKYKNVEKSPTHSEGRGIFYDLICETDTGHRFIVEMQRRNQTYFGNRATYYMCREIVEQGMMIRDKSKWQYEFIPVVGVFLTEFDLPGFENRVLVHGRMLDPETGKTVLNQIRCVFVQLGSFRKEKEECNTGFEKWMYILKNMERLQEIPFKTYRDGIFERLAELSEVSNLSESEYYEYNSNLKWARDYYATMEYAKKEGLAEGRAEGRAEGIAKGRAEGIAKGIAKGRAEGIAKGRAEGRAEGIAKGIAKGRAEGITEGITQEKIAIARNLKAYGMDAAAIAATTGLSIKEIEDL